MLIAELAFADRRHALASTCVRALHPDERRRVVALIAAARKAGR